MALGTKEKVLLHVYTCISNTCLHPKLYLQRYMSQSECSLSKQCIYCNLLLVNVYTLTYKCIHLLKHFEYDIHLLNVQRCMKIMHMTIDCVMYVLYICTAHIYV